LLVVTQSCDIAVLSVQLVTTRRQIVILVGLNTSPYKLKLVFNFSFHFLQLKQLLTMSMYYFSYEAYRLLCFQIFFGCLEEINIYCCFLKKLSTYIERKSLIYLHDKCRWKFSNEYLIHESSLIVM